ncbi:Oidioi.mRNA.OKI2018_I69.chr2.g4876.t1.cds [Oikopleura dioica]|uniref:Oidioi.mRNA.OKI2018_I69.chr2.g4876.t1.cds n=1 Tax=Oikopleura dioica TaxID=34765 RepID=A0ABN7T7T2_OIKDI|nr:Oidioi.mRNA.OKI2018_I69.chr2.g4876.t1.cds [Oikopleura dioica]
MASRGQEQEFELNKGGINIKSYKEIEEDIKKFEKMKKREDADDKYKVDPSKITLREQPDEEIIFNLDEEIQEIDEQAIAELLQEDEKDDDFVANVIKWRRRDTTEINESDRESNRSETITTEEIDEFDLDARRSIQERSHSVEEGGQFIEYAEKEDNNDFSTEENSKEKKTATTDGNQDGNQQSTKNVTKMTENAKEEILDLKTKKTTKREIPKLKNFKNYENERNWGQGKQKKARGECRVSYSTI